MTTEQPAPSAERRYLILAICCLSLLIVGMDATIVNVALPSIRADFHASVSGLQWTIDAYTLVIASLLILGGSTGDRIGRRRTFQTGLVLFTAGSLLCSVAPSLGWLIAFRAVQAVGGSMLNPVAMSIITNVFIDARERARAIGIWGATVGVSMGLGPVVGGALTDGIGWRAIFWINVPIGVTAIVLAALFVPESRAPRARRVDPVGQFLVIVVLATVTYAIIEGPRLGWISAAEGGLLAVVVVALVALLTYEPRRVDPLIDIRFFNSTPFAGATVIAICAFSAFSGFLFLNTLYLQDARGLSALHAGLFLLPMAAMVTVFASVSGRLVANRGPRLPLLLAGLGMVVSAVLLSQLNAHTSYLQLMGTYMIFGIGFGLVNVPITNTAVSGMPRSQAGVAAAFASTSRQTGSALGVAIVGSIVSTSLGGSLRQTLPSATHPAWWFIAGAAAAVIVLGFVTTSARARATVSRTAALFEADAQPAADPNAVAASRS